MLFLRGTGAMRVPWHAAGIRIMVCMFLIGVNVMAKATAAGLERMVTRALAKQPIVDMHTHLYPPSFGTPVANKSGKVDDGGFMLWGLDELLTYHYLIAEVYRVVRAD